MLEDSGQKSSPQPVWVDPLRQRADDLIASVRVSVDGLIQTDALTGLRNKRGLQNKLDALMSGDDAFWCAFVELDKFKAINSKHGYAAADGLLQAIAQVLREFADNSASEAFRAHGDEFYLVGMNLAAVKETLEHVAEAIRERKVHVPGSGQTMTCTASIGWTIVDRDAEVHRDEVMKQVELAVDEAKWHGGDTVEQYVTGISKVNAAEIRQQCTACRVRFSANLPAGCERETVYCPSCAGVVPLSEEEIAALSLTT
jgi:diguanylate cyclase (GGDEF)-like protein